MIAYVQKDGKIIGACYAESSEVLKTITKVPADCMAVYINDEKYPDVWKNSGEYTIQNGVPVFTPIPDSVKLQAEQDAKIAQLTELQTQANQVFKSSALGTEYTYLADNDAMSKFNAEYTFVNGPAYGGEPILWFTLEEGGVEHTKEQFNRVWMDGRNYIASNFSKWDSLVKQVKLCKTVEDVHSIQW